MKRLTLVLCPLVIVLLSSVSARAGAIEISGSLINVNLNFNFTGEFSRVISRTGRPDVVILFQETPTTFVFTITGGDFDSNGTLVAAVGGDFWAGTVSISEDAGFINDALTVGGNFRHIIEPHEMNRASTAQSFVWDFVMDADNLTEDANDTLRGTDSRAGSRLHLDSPHSDNFTASILVRGINTGNFDDITFHNTEITGTHVPEPTTLILLGTGLAGVGFKTRKRLKLSRKHKGNS